MTRIKSLELQGFKSFATKTKLIFPHGFNCVIGANGSGKCLRGDSKVILSTGELKTIKELVENALNKSSNVKKLDDGFCTFENPEGIKILCLDENGKIVEREVGAFVKRNSPKQLIKIKTRSGREVVTTDYHPVFTFKNGKIVSINAGELNVGEYIAMPRKYQVKEEIDLTKYLFRIKPEDKIYLEWKEEYKKLIKEIRKKIDLGELGIPRNFIKGIIDGQSINLGIFLKLLKEAGIEYLVQEIHEIQSRYR